MKRIIRPGRKRGVRRVNYPDRKHAGRHAAIAFRLLSPGFVLPLYSTPPCHAFATKEHHDRSSNGSPDATRGIPFVALQRSRLRGPRRGSRDDQLPAFRGNAGGARRRHS